MKKIILSLLILCFVGFKSYGQVYTQTFVDKCTGEIKIATTTYVNGTAVVSFYNQIKTFTQTQATNGTLQAWLQQTYNDY